MNTFPFVNEKYRLYRNTFLQNVTVGFDFPNSSVEKERLNAQFGDYLQRFFGITNSGDLTQSVCSISKQDLAHSFAFTNHSAVIQIMGKNYQSFSDTVIPLVFKLRGFFNKVVETSGIETMGIRKLNVINIKADKDSPIDVNNIMGHLFSNELVSYLNTDNMDDQEKLTPNFRKCIFKSEDIEVTIRTALLPPSTSNDVFHHLILDILAMSRPSSTIKIEEMADKLMDLNSVIYRCFHWCISSNVKELMLKDAIK